MINSYRVNCLAMKNLYYEVNLNHFQISRMKNQITISQKYSPELLWPQLFGAFNPILILFADEMNFVIIRAKASVFAG